MADDLYKLRSTYHNSFFVLRTEVIVNDQPTEIGCSEDSELTLYCRNNPVAGDLSTANCSSISIPSVSAKIEAILRKYGVEEVERFFCEKSPLYQVLFSSEQNLKKFLKMKMMVEKEIADALSQTLQQLGAPTTLALIRVNASIFLISPNPASKQCAKPVEVTLDNTTTCMAVWKESEVFDFGDLFRLDLMVKGEVQLTTVAVLREVEEVAEWFVLGTHLNLPQHELKIIQQDHPSNSKECRLAMVDTWIRLGNASWSGLVSALSEIGRCALAKRIAVKFGTTLPPTTQIKNTTDHKFHQTTEHCLMSEQRGTPWSQLVLSIEQQDRDLEKQTASIENVVETKAKIFRNRNYVKHNLTAALNKVQHLHQEKETLTTQLTQKENWLQTLQDSGLNLQSMVVSLENEIKQLKEELAQKDEELSIADAELLLQEKKDLSIQLTQKKSRLKTSQESGDNVLNMVESLKEEIDELKVQFSLKNTEIAKVTTEANDLRAELKEATSKLVETSSELSKLKHTKETLSSELERERRELQKMHIHSTFKDSAIVALKGELSDMRVEATSKAEETAVLKYRLSTQNEEVENLRRALNEAEQHKPALLEQPDAAAVLEQELRHEMETSDLRVKLATAEEGRSEVERQLKAVQREDVLLKEEIKDVKMCAASCTGLDLKKAYLRETNVFSVCTVTEGRERFEAPKAVVTGELHSLNGIIKCDVSQTEENEYVLQYEPNDKGYFQLDVKVNGLHVTNSPFQVEVLERLQLAEGTVVKSIDGLNFPLKLAISNIGEIVVAEYIDNCVNVFDHEGQKTLSFGNQGHMNVNLYHPRGVALLSDNTIVVAAEHCVKKFRMDGSFIATVGSSNRGSGILQFDTPWAVAADERVQRIYVCDTYNHRIQVLDFDLSYCYTLGSRGTGPHQFDTPEDIAIDSHQNLFIADYGNHRVQVFNSNSTFLYQIKQRAPGMEELRQPHSVCIDRDDNVYVLEYSKALVSIFSNKGEFLKSFGQEGAEAGELYHPHGIAVDRFGYVYISECGTSRIQIFK